MKLETAIMRVVVQTLLDKNSEKLNQPEVGLINLAEDLATLRTEMYALPTGEASVYDYEQLLIKMGELLTGDLTIDRLNPHISLDSVQTSVCNQSQFDTEDMD